MSNSLISEVGLMRNYLILQQRLLLVLSELQHVQCQGSIVLLLPLGGAQNRAVRLVLSTFLGVERYLEASAE